MRYLLQQKDFFYFPLGDGIALNPEKFKRKSFKKNTQNFWSRTNNLPTNWCCSTYRLAENRVVVSGNWNKKNDDGTHKICVWWHDLGRNKNMHTKWNVEMATISMIHRFLIIRQPYCMSCDLARKYDFPKWSKAKTMAKPKSLFFR